MSEINRNCKECFSYVPYTDYNLPGCCKNNSCNYEILSSITNTNPTLVKGASFQTYLQSTENNFFTTNQTVNTEIVSTYNTNNQQQISSLLVGQLITFGKNRFSPYQRLPPPFIPPSVLQMQRESINVGVPHAVNICRPKNTQASF